MLLHKDTILLFSIFFIPIFAILIGNINIGGANIQFFFSVISMFVGIFYLLKWGRYELSIYILPIFFTLLLSTLLLDGKFGLIQSIYVATPLVYFLCGFSSKFDNDFDKKIKEKIKMTILLSLLLACIYIFSGYTQIYTRPVSIYLSLICMLSIILLDDIKYKLFVFFLFLFVLFSGARGALIACFIPLIFSYINKRLGFKNGFIFYLVIVLIFSTFMDKFLSMIFSIDSLRERTFFDGVYSFDKILNIEFNTSGRNLAWPVYWQHIFDRSYQILPTLFGEGAGTSSVIGLNNVGEKWAHPHNEFIRILLDYGIFGLLSFLFFWIGSFFKIIKKNNRLHSTLFFSLLFFTILISMTDNPLMYPLYFGNLILFLVGLLCNKNVYISR